MVNIWTEFEEDCENLCEVSRSCIAHVWIRQDKISNFFVKFRDFVSIILDFLKLVLIRNKIETKQYLRHMISLNLLQLFNWELINIVQVRLSHILKAFFRKIIITHHEFRHGLHLSYQRRLFKNLFCDQMEMRSIDLIKSWMIYMEH